MKTFDVKSHAKVCIKYYFNKQNSKNIRKDDWHLMARYGTIWHLGMYENIYIFAKIFNIKYYKMKILPGTNITFSLKRALGITNVRRKISQETGIPTTKQGVERKIGNAIIKSILGNLHEI